MKYILLIIILAICLIVSGAGIYTNNAFNSTNSDSNEIITLKIEQGESLQNISDDLKNKSLISSSEMFQLYAKLNNSYPTFQSGLFRIAKNLTFEQVSKVLAKPISTQITIKISEGIRYDEVVEQVNNQVIAQTCMQTEKDCFEEIARKFDKDEFANLIENPKKIVEQNKIELSAFTKKMICRDVLQCVSTLEGFLYPDTYFFNANVTSAEVLKKILDNFGAKFGSIYQQSYDLQSQNLSFYDVMKLTSVVTRESTHKSEDDSLIAGVLLNRLSQDYPLQCDTINHYYFKSWTYDLTQADLKKDYPYNSYLHSGLPPTPISNISIATLNNVLNATDTDYFYFLADKSGVLHYSKTWAEHVNFVNQYLR